MKTNTADLTRSVVVSTASVPVPRSGSTLDLDLADRRHDLCELDPVGQLVRERHCVSCTGVTTERVLRLHFESAAMGSWASG